MCSLAARMCVSVIGGICGLPYSYYPYMRNTVFMQTLQVHHRVAGSNAPCTAVACHTLIFTPLMTHPRTSGWQDGSKASSSTTSSPDKTVSSLFDNTNVQQKKPVVSALSDSTDVTHPSHPPSYWGLLPVTFSLTSVDFNTCMALISAHEEFFSFQKGEEKGWVRAMDLTGFANFLRTYGLTHPCDGRFYYSRIP